MSAAFGISACPFRPLESVYARLKSQRARANEAALRRAATDLA